MADDEKMIRAQSHAIALEQNQMVLHRRIADLLGQLHIARGDLATSVLREAELQTQVNVLVDVVNDLRKRLEMASSSGLVGEP
jgi:hypothetical protein